jgi:hypothetical protein
LRDISELSEEEAGWVKRLLIMYPEGFGYDLDRDPLVREFAAELVAEGRVERKEIDDGINPQTGEPARPQISYRLTDEHAEEIRRWVHAADAKRDAALFN